MQFDAHEIREELVCYLIYIHLMMMLSTKKYNVVKNPTLKKQLIELNDLIKTIDDATLIQKRDELCRLLKTLADYFIKLYPPKKPIETIAKEFDSFFKDSADTFSHGIEFGWLNDAIDFSSKRWPKDLPYQTKIGIGHHAGYANIETEFLLRDAFYAYVKAEDVYQNLVTLRDQLESNRDIMDLNFDKKLYDEVTLLKFNGAFYARLSIISFYSFIECFVNTLGYDYYCRNKALLDERDAEILHGRKKNRFLQLEFKIEKFPTIIRPDKKQLFFLKDEKQRKEPFKTFFKEYKNLRDASVHYAPLKEKIWLSPLDWITKAREFKDLTLDSALCFWRACYPESDGPEYLGKLDQKKHMELAKKRLTVEKQCEQQ